MLINRAKSIVSQQYITSSGLPTKEKRTTIDFKIVQLVIRFSGLDEFDDIIMELAVFKL